MNGNCDRNKSPFHPQFDVIEYESNKQCQMEKNKKTTITRYIARNTLSGRANEMEGETSQSDCVICACVPRGRISSETHTISRYGCSQHNIIM